MIPKKIHYCWFGGKELPKQAKKCIASWQKYCPDYEIIQWNEENFDITQNPYLQYCYTNKLWAYLTDLVRLLVVYEHGGLYFDTDVQVLRCFDPLLGHEAFFGWESKERVATGLGFGAEAAHPVLEAMIEPYRQMIPNADGTFTMTVCPILNTQALQGFGLKVDGTAQQLGGIRILPVEYLCPYEYYTGRMRKTENSYSIHWYNQSWVSPWGKIRCVFTKPFHRVFGEHCFDWLKNRLSH